MVYPARHPSFQADRASGVIEFGRCKKSVDWCIPLQTCLCGRGLRVAPWNVCSTQGGWVTRQGENGESKMRRLFALCLAAFSAAACDSGSSTEPGGGMVASTYALETVNGARLPATIFRDADGRIEATAGTLTLRGDRSYTESFQVRLVPTSGPSDSDEITENGTYSVVGSTITFTVPAGGGEPAFSYTGAINGDVLTYAVEGTSVQYRKR